MLWNCSFKRVVRVLMLVGAVACLGFAQNTSSGTVVGQVTDAQGKAITGAVVTLTNAATNSPEATITNTAGRYAFVNLQPGSYSLDVKKAGFKEATVKQQDVIVGKQLTLNVPMQVGEATQTVEVTASGAELQTMNSTVGDTITGAAIVLLPNISRDANSLTNLQPNTAPDGGVAGADSDQNSFTLDGGSNSDDMDGSHAVYNGTQGGATSGVIPVPADSIEQFSVGTINQTADVNSAAGASVAMVTRRGTDSIHGSAYEYYLGSYLAANSWSNNRRGAARAKSHQNRFGASLGGEILPNFLGGKTYLFGLFEGRRFPNGATYERNVPSALLRAGVVQAQPSSSAPWEAYNLNPTSVTVGGTTYLPATCSQPGGGTGACDPRALGLNPVVNQVWKQYMPVGNDPTSGDQYNTIGYLSNVSEPLTSNFFVTRLDHDFGAKNHLSVTYHFFFYQTLGTQQVDIGGALPGDTLGTPVATAVRPQLPSMWTAQLTSSLTPNLTNNFNYSYLRNFWQWGGTNTSPQVLGGGLGTLGGAVEIGGESTNALIPYNVNTQSVRQRFWDGIGNTFNDSLTLIKGNHLIQFGGKYTNQQDYHQRNDNGGGIMAANVYQITSGQGVSNPYLPSDFGTGASTSTYNTSYNEVLGIVNQPQTLYTRSGPTLALQPLGTPMFDKSSIPLYNVYFSDAWHMRPDLTLTYGTGYTVEMPPVEQQGKQVELVDAAGNLVSTTDYIASTERAALGGQVYNPTLAWATVGNVGAGLKYPYHPFYGGLSPRVSIAWNPTVNGGLLGALLGGNKSVIRGGWARIYGRLNGVDLVLVPLLGTGLGQAVACIGATSTGTCNGPGGATPATAFRIGPTAMGFDGMTAPLGAPPTPTLSQPYIPGVIQNGTPNPASGSGEYLDPNFKPDRSDEFDITWQRQVSQNFTTEIGYTGRIIRNEYQGVNLDNVPYMFTSGGQQFSQAFADVWKSVAAGVTPAPQPFFETALGGATSAFCTGYASCTAAVASKYGPGKGGKDYIDTVNGNDVYSLWAAMNQSSSWTLGRTFPTAPTTCSTPGVGGCPVSGVISGGGQMQAAFGNLSNGWGNYNSLFWTVNMRSWHNITATSNFTWSRAFGTGQTVQATSSYTVTDPYNMQAMYGPQYNDTPLNYNLFVVWQPGAKSQRTLLEHLTHGWAFAPILTWHNSWVQVNNNGDCASFGEGDCNAGSTQELAIKTSGNIPAASLNNVNITSGIGSSSKATGLNAWANPGTVYSQFRPIVLGIDTTGQSGWIPSFGTTDVDFSVTKDLGVWERFGAQLSAQATNVFNHFAPSYTSANIASGSSFGYISSNALGQRSVEIGLRLYW